MLPKSFVVLLKQLDHVPDPDRALDLDRVQGQGQDLSHNLNQKHLGEGGLREGGHLDSVDRLGNADLPDSGGHPAQEEDHLDKDDRLGGDHLQEGPLPNVHQHRDLQLNNHPRKGQVEEHIILASESELAVPQLALAMRALALASIPRVPPSELFLLALQSIQWAFLLPLLVQVQAPTILVLQQALPMLEQAKTILAHPHYLLARALPKI